ncbi:hypothetical protein [Streptomyces thermolilacinus]|uniref:hypothetical protein n=1 Tax=Streptomyces thermolilacinus TaxID=285540 RepID=UPI00340B89FD
MTSRTRRGRVAGERPPRSADLAEAVHGGPLGLVGTMGVELFPGVLERLVPVGRSGRAVTVGAPHQCALYVSRSRDSPLDERRQT